MNKHIEKFWPVYLLLLGILVIIVTMFSKKCNDNGECVFSFLAGRCDDCKKKDTAFSPPPSKGGWDCVNPNNPFGNKCVQQNLEGVGKYETQGVCEANCPQPVNTVYTYYPQYYPQSLYWYPWMGQRGRRWRRHRPRP